MYLEHFGLTNAPYRITPDTALFYAGAERGAILDALVYAISTGEAITKVVGEVGSGKTMLCRMLEQKLPNNVEIVYLANPSLPPENVLHAIALELGLPVGTDDNRLHVMKTLQNYLLQRHAENKQVVVFVEEAQGMPLATLEEIRLLSNLETQHHKLLQVVLFGQPELDEGLKTPSVRQIKERITNSFNLSQLRRREIGDYLTFRLHLAGYRGEPLFSSNAVTLVSWFSKGLMRRINILADKALLAAYAAGSRVVTARHVAAALSDCEFSRSSFPLVKATAVSLLAVPVLVVGMWQLWGSLELTSPVAAVAAPRTLPRTLIEKVEKIDVADAVDVVDVIDAIEDAPPAIPQKVVAVNALLAQRMNATRDWLTQSRPEHFTIQVLWAKPSERDSVTPFLQLAQEADVLSQLFVYREGDIASGAINAVYGEYASYSGALAALAELPDVLKRYSPYLRNVRGVLVDAQAPHLLVMDNTGK
ncbi:ExeA family protein [Pseudomonadota bacterium]